MIDLSVIIPTRNETYLQQTVDDLLLKARGSIEVIVVLDGYWPEPPLKKDPRVVVLHHGTMEDNPGMRASINLGMANARGKYVMKSDGHCLFDDGFDVKLIADCGDNWLVIPRRLRLDAENWKVAPDRRPPVDYNYLSYPYLYPIDNPRGGLHGMDWRERYYANQEVLIDDTMSTQGSLYFTTRKYWFEMIGPMDISIYGPFTQEAQEICGKVWLGGGRCVVNKKTWYAHLHKNKGKNYNFTHAQYAQFYKNRDFGCRNSTDYWINNRWEGRIHDFAWLIDKFWPVPTWPTNWKEQLVINQAKENS